MLPVGDDNHRITRFPGVTYALIAVNVLAFIYELTLGPELENFVREYGAVPAAIMNGENYFSLLSSMFLHGGWAHIIGNMLFLKVFGDNVEDRFGHGGFLLFYLVTGLAASMAHILLDPGSRIPSVGASGAISGVLGAYIILFPRNAVLIWMFFTIFTVPAWLMIGFWAAEQFLATYGSVVATEQTTGGVAYAAHAGGFVAGVVLALFVRAKGGGKREEEPAMFGGSRYYR